MALEQFLEKVLGKQVQLQESSFQGGGYIAHSRKISLADGRSFFLKSLPSSQSPVLGAEFQGLQLLAGSKNGPLYTPEPIGFENSGEEAFLLMEFLSMGSRGDEEAMGKGLAELHSNTADLFGLDHNNFIGSTPQFNQQTADWIEFYRDQRLRPQINWARKKGAALSEADKLLDHLGKFFEDEAPQAVLLHGDLWSGNAAYLSDGCPVVFDPAVYYGHRETDLAMMEMFGGFSDRVYRAYSAVLPIPPAYNRNRRDLYQLYHVLNHYNLFGGSYLHSAERIIRNLISR